MSYPAEFPISNQLLEYRKEHENEDNGNTTTDGGNLAVNVNTSLTIGKRGPVLLEDLDFFDIMQHFNRERIPERVVHAKGAGAFGFFEVTHDVSQYTAAKVFNGIGKRTHIAVRFSQVTFEMGSQDTTRDVRGFAIKFYTEDGTWDLVGNNTPIFFIQDSKLFPDLIHILKRNPVTHVRDWNMFWDFFSLRPESIHQLLIFYSDRGIPNGYRRMNGYGSNTFSLINKEGVLVYCKFHYLTNQGISNLEANSATLIAGQDPDYALRDLYNAIATGNFPSWNFYIQVMTQEQVQTCNFNPFDVTKVWPHSSYPLIPVGQLHLNKNPSNYFAEIEQLSFNPGSFVPGINGSPDKVLQGRLMAYSDTSRYRLGVNYLQIPVNSPNRINNFNRDGFMTIRSQGGAPNYHPNSFGGPEESVRAKLLYPSMELKGISGFYDLGFDDNFTQPRIFYQTVLDDGAKTRLIQNIVNDLKNASSFIQERQINVFKNVDSEFGRRVCVGLKKFCDFTEVDL
ncbi:catalase-like [Onthophagus taurus]|uniref:catalase-like n=1 Tax=Onthophagus taurus TaxID=166361 RepID=UPI000C20DBBD|nr:catalase-like [Onthophagus taurus]